MKLDIHTFTVTLPNWTAAFLQSRPVTYPTIEDRMRLAIELSRLNVERRSGGPFGAAVFDNQNGNLISVGVNVVVASRCSQAHAEMTAIALAQQTLSTHNPASKGTFQLVSSCQPCAMCLGAIGWSGMKSLVCGARGEDAEAIGFDEGAKPAEWVKELEKRGIEVTLDILHAEAKAVLNAYKSTNGIIY
ncbi:MAG: nucleoside deaminase [Planctomycetes bacterium]|nr:nucleoside deaminase [Planctomycetota bacterium]